MSLSEEIKYEKLVGIGKDGEFYVRSQDKDILKKAPLGKLVGEKIITLLERYSFDLKKARVVDIGSGPGGISLAFARRVKEVFATDVSEVGLKFVQKRAAMEGIKNIYFKKIDLAERLPFNEETFDIAILKGVLEWVPETNLSGDPELIQINSLKEVKRILKKRGILFLAIENRYYLRYLFGLREVHSGLYFASYLPRRIANVDSWIFRGKPFRTYTYSYKHLRKLLVKAGFSSWEFYTGIPSYQIPEHICRLGDRRKLKKCINLYYKNNLKKIFAKIILSIPYFGPYLFFPNNFIVVIKK